MMLAHMAIAKERWGTRVGLVLAMAGNAVGLGNFLRFPAQAAQNGGGAFLIPYLISFVLMGIPLLWVEWSIGRFGGIHGYHSSPGMLDKMGRYKWLKYAGVFGIFTNVCVAAYYCYIESWTLAYVFHSLKGTFKTVSPTEFFPAYLADTPEAMFAVPWIALVFFIITLTLNMWIISLGVAKGIEVAAKIGMPLLFVFAAILAVRGLLLTTADPGVTQSPLVGLNFVWSPDPSGLTNPTVWLAAAGQVFFTLSVGVGSIHCYASYLREKQDIALNSSAAGWMNEFVEVILGSTLLIPIATAYLGIEAVQAATAGGSGFGLGFLTLPTLFNNWGPVFGPLAGALWFGLLFFAGITSSLAMGQPIIAFLGDEFGINRRKAAVLLGGVLFALGFFTIWLYPGGAFDEFDFWIGTFALVVFGLIESFVFAYVLGIDRGWEELTRGADIKLPIVFKYIMKYVTPVFILVIFVTSLIKPEGGDWGASIGTLMSGGGWALAPDSVIGKILHVGSDYVWFVDGAPTRVLIEDISRMILSAVFLLCLFLIWKAWKIKERSEA